jgi:hypothetical protein
MKRGNTGDKRKKVSYKYINITVFLLWGLSRLPHKCLFLIGTSAWAKEELFIEQKAKVGIYIQFFYVTMENPSSVSEFSVFN